ncbi:MAG: hypothetical protein JST09_04930 [Bacteroidetes bacterium]|nr:hypothetical protein [Bacteroidota bacterium]MBS1574628.1 hypothetical protein [Bacteroidota bacterium]
MKAILTEILIIATAATVQSQTLISGKISNQKKEPIQSVNPQNPRAFNLVGWQKFATPKAWGGDKAKAKELLQQANQLLMQESDAGVSSHWGKTEVEELLKQIK